MVNEVATIEMFVRNEMGCWDHLGDMNVAIEFDYKWVNFLSDEEVVGYISIDEYVELGGEDERYEYIKEMAIDTAISEAESRNEKQITSLYGEPEYDYIIKRM